MQFMDAEVVTDERTGSVESFRVNAQQVGKKDEFGVKRDSVKKN